MTGLMGCKPAPEEIQFLTWASPRNQQGLKNSLESFSQRNPEIKVQATILEDEEACRREWLNRQAKGKVPDIWMMPDTDFHSFTQQNILHEISHREYPFSDQIIPELMIRFKVNDRLYAGPIHWSTEVLYYNKKIFERHGIPLPMAHWDWSDLMTAAKALTVQSNEGDETVQWGLDLSTETEHWIPFLLQNCGQLQNGNYQWVMADPQYIQSNAEAVEFYSGLRRDFTDTLDKEERGSHFLSGNAAMTIDSRDFIPLLSEKAKFEWDISPLPRGRQQGTLVRIHALVISKQSQHLKATVALLNFLSSEVTQSASALNGASPTLSDLLFSRIFLEFPGTRTIHNISFVDSLKFATCFPKTPAVESVKHILNEEIDALITNPDRGGRETLETMQIRLEELDLTLKKKY